MGMIQIVHSKIKTNKIKCQFLIEVPSPLSNERRSSTLAGIFSLIYCYRANIINITNEGVFQVSSKSKKIHFFIKTNLTRIAMLKLIEK